MKTIIPALFATAVALLVGVVTTLPSLFATPPEEQGAMAKRCEANGFDWHMGDWGKIICDKKEVKK